MKKNFILALILVIPVLSACGRLGSESETQTEGTDPDMIALQDGTIMRVSCVKSKAAAIMAEGRGAADSCVMGNAKRAVDSEGRGFGNTYPSWWSSYYVYPPYYYGGDYSSLCTYLGFYGSGYGYGTSSSYNNYNCYSNFLGYDQTYYGSYNNNCDSCLNRANPSRCYNRCLYRSGWYW